MSAEKPAVSPVAGHESPGVRVRSDLAGEAAAVRPKILATADYFSPGFKGGGPVRAIDNLTSQLATDFEFWILTRDRDLRDSVRYPAIEADRWCLQGSRRLHYVAPGSLSVRSVLNRIGDAKFDLVYVNSIFSAFTRHVLLLNRMRLLTMPVLIAPRGELAAPSLQHKWLKKRVYLHAARQLSLYRGLTWQASTEHEVEDIRRFLCHMRARGAEIVLAGELPTVPPVHVRRSAKVSGIVRAVFLSRIHRVKNLRFALDALRDVRDEILFDIYGPIEDVAYWRECQESIRRLPPNVRVRYQGTVQPESVHELFAGYDVLFLPTTGENYGHVIIEALSAGCPVLISERTRWRGLEDAGAGWDIPLADMQAFTATLSLLAGMGGTDHERLSAGARRYAGCAMKADGALRTNREMFRRLVDRRSRREHVA